MPRAPVKTVRIPHDLRRAIRKEAERRGSNESAIIREALRAYLAQQFKEAKHAN